MVIINWNNEWFILRKLDKFVSIKFGDKLIILSFNLNFLVIFYMYILFDIKYYIE